MKWKRTTHCVLPAFAPLLPLLVGSCYVQGNEHVGRQSMVGLDKTRGEKVHNHWQDTHPSVRPSVRLFHGPSGFGSLAQATVDRTEKQRQEQKIRPNPRCDRSGRSGRSIGTRPMSYAGRAGIANTLPPQTCPSLTFRLPFLCVCARGTKPLDNGASY